ncbi:MAG: 4Fe-4S binding protein [Nitrososphaeria archaeon]
MRVNVKLVNVGEDASAAIRSCVEQNYAAFVKFIDEEIRPERYEALLVVGARDVAEGFAAAESIDTAGMDAAEILYHTCAKIGKLSDSDAITAKTESMFRSPNLSRRGLITGITHGYQLFSEYPLINDSLCEARYGCKKCIEACPEKALSFSGSLVLDSSRCTKCGLCAASCPVAAVQMPKFSEDAFIGLLEGLTKVYAPRRILVLTESDEKHIPYVHVEKLETRTISIRWILMALKSGLDMLIIRGSVSEDVQRALINLKNLTGRVLLIKNENLEDIIEEHEFEASGLEAIGFSRSDYWFNYIVSINSVIKQGTEVEGLSLTEMKVSETCTLCGACSSECPRNALRIDLSGELGKLEFNPSLCTGCGFCVNVCPEGSIEIYGQKRVNTKPVSVYQDELVRCARCGKPIYSKKFYDQLVTKLGKEDPMLKYCNECKQKVIYERLFRKNQK